MRIRRALSFMLLTVAAASTSLAQVVPPDDLAEASAPAWGTFASDGQPASVSAETTLVKVGSTARRFTTDSGFATGVRIPTTPLAGAARWDLTGKNYLLFWVFADNSTPIGFQGNQPIVTIKTSTGNVRLEAQGTQMSNLAWRLYKVPLLAGTSDWARTTTGAPNLGQVTQIEMEFDTWDAGFDLVFDGVRFASLTPGSLPPAGPPPPPGVNPDKIEPKVLLYVIDPIIESRGGQRLHQALGWFDPQNLATQMANDLRTSSHGLADYRIVETVVADEWPPLQSGFRYTDQSFLTMWNTPGHPFEPGTFDYEWFVNTKGIGPRVDAGEIDEVWVYAFPGTGMFESAMAGRGAYWINGAPFPRAGGERAFVIMGLNYERGVAEAIHSYGHRSENIMVHSYGEWSPTGTSTWSRFSRIDRDVPGLGSVGNVHFPVNAESDYDYANPRFVMSDADDWLNYPNLTGARRSLNFRAWSPAGADAHREFLNWWYFRMPHVGGRAPDFYLGNWWRYLVDVDQFKTWNGKLDLSLGIPSVATTAPAHGSTATRGDVVAVRAAASVDGALGRVDLYVDGQYHSTDSLSPYTFAWNTAAAAVGQHTLVTKAYELQNGTEAVAAPITVTVSGGPCRTDVNGSGGQPDVADIFAFLSRWFAHDPRADFNGSGLIEVSDIFAFLTEYFAGC